MGKQWRIIGISEIHVKTIRGIRGLSRYPLAWFKVLVY
jgi:hypothetical protein